MTARSGDEMNFLDHLEELRWRLIKSAIAVVAFAIPCGIWWERIFDLLLIYPIAHIDPKPHLIFTAPHEAVMLSIKIAVFGGIICAVPVIFYQLWRFIAPGLYKKEKKIVLPVVFASVVCFLLGLGFSYLSVPYMMGFMLRFAAQRMEAMLKTSEYISFIIKICLAFGLIFELPVVSFILTRMEMITPQFLIAKMRYAIVIIFLAAAVLTPPDVLSQVFLAVPLLLLYAISILVSYLARVREPAQ